MLKMFKEQLGKYRFLRSVFTLASASALGQLILVLVTPILTRLYSPDDFGALAVFAAIMAVLLVVSSLRYELAIPLPRGERNSISLLRGALVINLIMALICLIVVVLFRSEIAHASKTPALSGYLLLLPLAILGGGTYKALNYWAVRNNAYDAIAKTRITQSVANAGIQIAAGLASAGSLGLILGQVLAQTVGAVRLSIGVKLEFQTFRLRRERLRLKVLLSRYRRFPKYDVPAAFFDQISSQLPNLLLAMLFSPTVAGWYILADRILSMPISLVGQAVGQVLFGASRSAIHERKLFPLAIRVSSVLAALAVLPTLILFLFAPDIFSFVFGEVWREAGQYASWMILGLAVQFVYSPLSMLLMATEGQQLNLRVHLWMMLAKIGVVYYGYYIGSSLISIIGFSIVGLMGYAIAILFLLRHTYRHDKLVKE